MYQVGIDIGSSAANVAVIKDGQVVQLIAQVKADKYYLTGGLCDDEYVVERLSKALGAPVETHPLARYAGAIGAAILAEN